MRTASKIERQSAKSDVLSNGKAGPIHRRVPAARRDDIRVDKVAAVRAAIEAGTYDEAIKMEVAVDRLLDELRAGDFSAATKMPIARWHPSKSRRIAPR